MTVQREPEDLAQEAFPLDGSEPSTVFECRRRLIKVIRAEREQASDPLGRFSHTEQPFHSVRAFFLAHGLFSGREYFDRVRLAGDLARRLVAAIIVPEEVHVVGESLTADMVEQAARAMFEDPLALAEYTWAEMVAEDPSRAEIWRDDARRILIAAVTEPTHD